MTLICCSWLLLFCFFITYGTAARFLIKSSDTTIPVTLLLGMVLQTVLLTTAAFFVPIGPGLFIANAFGALVLGIFFRRKIAESISGIAADYISFSVYSRSAIIIILVTALLKCAQSPFILDNESYYVQTVKWLNEYGFVKGLANLNVSFGQASPWHILQSGFSFSFVTDRLNDINGFLLLACSFCFLSAFEKKWKEDRQFHWIGFVLFFNILSFQFINSPSPDLPLFLIMQIILLLYLKQIKAREDTRVILVLFIFLAFIKITIAPLGIIMLFLLNKEKKAILFTFITAALFGTLWAVKNAVLTGYPLYPFGLFALDADWKIPENLLLFINNMIRNHEFMGIANYRTVSVWEKFTVWIRFGGINGLFNKGIVVLFVLAPFAKTIRSQAAYKIVYCCLLLHFITVLIISPQFRFFLTEFIFLSAILSASILNGLRMQPKLVFASLTICALLPLTVLFGGDFKSLTDNVLNQESEAIHWSQLLLPEKNAKYSDVKFVALHKGNLKYYSPMPNFFFYGTADGPLPCTNVKFMDYIEKTCFFIPQLRTGNLQDGFYAAGVPKATLP